MGLGFCALTGRGLLIRHLLINVILEQRGGYSEFTATKDIEIGEELFQSFGEPLRIN